MPYAKPPVGNLRFKKPQEAEGWSGVRDVSTSEGITCPQFAPDLTGEGTSTWANVTTLQ